jgi:hypothetical protein
VQLETSVSDALIDIRVYNETKRAAMCQRCGVKIYPPVLLELHLERHRMRDEFLREEVKKLQATMGRMKAK